jgi:hypothetical protein
MGNQDNAQTERIVEHLRHKMFAQQENSAYWCAQILNRQSDLLLAAKVLSENASKSVKKSNQAGHSSENCFEEGSAERQAN